MNPLSTAENQAADGDLSGPAKLAGVRVRWAAWAILGFAGLVSSGILLQRVWPEARVVNGTLLSLTVWGYLGLLAFRYLPLNRRPRDRVLLSQLGPGTNLTLLRGLLLAALAGFWVVETPSGLLSWIPAGLYTLAAAVDYVDGYAARRSNTETALGERLDLESDALGLLTAVGLAVKYGKLPWPFLAIGIARYLFVWTQALLKRRGAATSVLPESVSRRPIAGITMGFVSASLWPVVTPAAATLAGILFLSAFAFSFTRDWLVIAGIIDPRSRRYIQSRQAAKVLLLDRLPVGVRVLAGMSGAFVLRHLMQGSGGNLYLLGNLQNGSSEDLLTALLLGTSMMMVVGLLARSAAFLHFFPLGLLIAGSGLNGARMLMLVSAVLMLLLGSGDLSIWDPERRIFARRAGDETNGN